MRKVAIVILNWNGKEDTLECLKSLEKLRVENYQLQTFVVDNASTDGSVDAIGKRYKNINIINNRQNLGFAEGNNVGIRRALKNDSDYIVLLNNDTIVDKDLINGLVETFNENPDAGIVSPKIYFARGFEFHKDRYKKKELGKVIWYAGGKFDWDNVLGSHRGVDEVDKGQYDQSIETDFATGCCMALRSETLKKIGLFDKEYFLYLEDVDLCQRAKKAGFKILYSPKGHLWHKVARSSGIGSGLNDYYITRNRLLFASKYASIRAKLALFRESLKLLFSGRFWQKRGVLDFYFGNFENGCFSSKGNK